MIARAFVVQRQAHQSRGACETLCSAKLCCLGYGLRGRHNACLKPGGKRTTQPGVFRGTDRLQPNVCPRLMSLY